MVISEDSWFSGILGRPVYRVECSEPNEVVENIARHAATQSSASYFTKVDTTKIDLLQQFMHAGMYVVDVNVTFAADLIRLDFTPSENQQAKISEITSGQVEDVLNIASTAFRYSRFHLDPGISTEAANRARYEWIKNYIDRKRGLSLLVATLGSVPAGFLAINWGVHAETPAQVIDLIAVDEKFRNRGVAEAMIHHLFRAARDNVRTILVGTQIANIPSVRLYEKLGFRLIGSQYVLHMHKQ